MNSGFEGLDDALNTDYDVDKEIDNISERSELLNKTKTEVSKNTDNSLDATIEDKEYIAMELKMIIQNSRNILDVLEQDIKIGTQPRYHEVYATLTKSIIDGLKELRELNQTVVQLRLQKEKIELKRISSSQNNNLQIGTQVNMNLTGKDLFKMIESAKTNSSLNAIDVDFELDASPPEEY